MIRVQYQTFRYRRRANSLDMTWRADVTLRYVTLRYISHVRRHFFPNDSSSLRRLRCGLLITNYEYLIAGRIRIIHRLSTVHTPGKCW